MLSHWAKSWTVGLVITVPPSPKKEQCNKCGHEEHFPGSKCPATSRACNYCETKGHYASKCYKKQQEAAAANLIDEKKEATSGSNTNSNDTYEISQIINHLETTKHERNRHSMRVLTNDQKVLWQPDTGTQRDVWDKKLFHKFEKCGNGAIPLIPTSTRLYAYGSDKPLDVIVTFKAVLATGKHMFDTEIYVTSETAAYPLLSEQSAAALGLIHYNESFLVHQLTKPSQKMLETKRQAIIDMISANLEVFTGKICKVKTKDVSLMIDHTVQLVVQKQHRVPCNLRDVPKIR